MLVKESTCSLSIKVRLFTNQSYLTPKIIDIVTLSHKNVPLIADDPNVRPLKKQPNQFTVLGLTQATSGLKMQNHLN